MPPFGCCENLISLFLYCACSNAAIRFWPYGIVPFTMSRQFDTIQARFVQEAMKAIEDISCVRFVPFDGEENDRSSPRVHIDLSKAGDGCWSSDTGFSGRTQTMRLESDVCFETGTILHELMHVLGFLHEHNRPDRDHYVLVIWERIPPEKRYAFMKRSLSENYPIDRLSGYDSSSIMHYSEYAFSRKVVLDDGGTVRKEPTIISKRGRRLGGAKTLTRSDVHRLNEIYQCADYNKRCENGGGRG